MRMSIRAQAAIEYLMVLAVAFTLIVPAAYFFMQYSTDSAYRAVDAHIQKIGRLFVETSQAVYYSGSGSKLIVEVQMPEEVEHITILDNREMVFNVTSSFGHQEVVFFSRVNMSSASCLGNRCVLDEIAGLGKKKVRFESIQNGNQVLVREG